ncbi:MAG: hypothetical protein KatS3mg110_1218 [Pirellulaceae bacterium]|nr:MAG: hypothetical protein KatS3mg110_1218 [Pirellulaceae bacterium]
MGIRFFCPHCQKRLNVKAFLAGKQGYCPNCHGQLAIPRESDPAALRVSKEVVRHGGSATGVNPGLDSMEADEGAWEERAVELPSQPTPAAQPGAASAVYAGKDAAPSTNSASPTGSQLAAGQMVLPLPADSIWYVRTVTGEQYGPATAAVFETWLSEGRVAPAMYVWRDGWPAWRLASEVFAPSCWPAPAAVRPAARSRDNMPNTTHAMRALAEYERRKRRQRQFWAAAVVVLLVVAIVLTITLVFVLRRSQAR